MKSRLAILVGVCLCTYCCSVFAGGGGANMILVVNQNDEKSIRIAEEYQKLRNIPDGNIVFVDNPYYNNTNIQSRIINQTTSTNYLNTVANAISSRGLSDQIDYIGLIGTPQVVLYGYTYQAWDSTSQSYVTKSATAMQSLSYQFSQLTQLLSGVSQRTLGSSYMPIAQTTDMTIGSNTAIHHSDVYSKSYSDGTMLDTQYYMSGFIGYAGQFGNTTDQVISNLRYTVSGDGAKPAGTVYFEENDDVRSNTREYQWDSVQTALTERGVAYIEERGQTPANRDDVQGAVIGAMTYTANGSTYLPGSWADSLTSFGSDFGSMKQTKATTLIAAGAGGSSGTVDEPYATSSRFPNASIHVSLADGSTIGEAFYKATLKPDLQMLLGDMLAQPNADLPQISVTAAPSSGQTVNGAVNIEASASLSNSTIATGIAQMKLLVDGKETQTISGDNASFNLDTSTLSDGQHELRIVAVNNAAAESQSEKSWSVNVNNKGQSVNATSGDITAADKQLVNVSVAANSGSGASVDHIELRNMGRVMGEIGASSGTINVDASKLAYGDNPIIPVAVMSDGSEVAGEAFSINRTPTYIAGLQNVTGERVVGIKVEYFEGKGATKIANCDFSGTPTQTVVMSTSALKNSAASVQDYGLGAINSHPGELNMDKLAVRMTGMFELLERGEYSFVLNKTNDSAALSVDGIAILAYDNQGSYVSYYGNCVYTLFLDAGIHEFELLTANLVNSADAASTRNCYDIALLYQGPDGLWQTFNSTTAFIVVPEPLSACSIVMALSILLCRNKRK